MASNTSGIRNFEFPGVTLEQTFEQVPSGGGATQMSVVCIGPVGTPEVGSANIVNQTAQSFVAPEGATITAVGATVFVTGGVFNYCERTESVGMVLNVDSTGLESTTNPPTLETTSGTFDPAMTASDTVILGIQPEGSTSVLYNTFTVVQVSDSQATLAYTSGDGVPEGGGEFPLTELYCQRAVQSTAICGSTTSPLTLSGGTITVDPTKVLVAREVVVGEEYKTGDPAKLYSGTVSFAYRVSDLPADTAIKSVTNPADVETVLGPITNDNPLAAAVYCAAVEAKGATVYYLPVLEDSAAGYRRAVAALEAYDNIYSVVLAIDDTIPCMTATDAESGSTVYDTIVTGVHALLVEQSSDEESKVRRTLWYGVTNEDASPKVDDIVARNVTHSYRSQCVFADGVQVAGAAGVFSNYAAAAAAAGMRSYEPAHRPISNLPFTALSSVTNRRFTRAEQRDIAKHGIWIIDNNYNNTPVTLRQLTTAAKNNLNEDEESIVANADEIALSLCHVGEDMVGCSNIHPRLLMSLRDTITLIMNNKLVNTTGSVYIGPQLLSWELVELYQSPTALDHIYATITCEPPKPFNRFHITLRVI